MTHITLPTNLTVRSAYRDDAQAIAEINAEHELALAGTAESTIGDVFELWDSERMVLADNTRAILAPSGELVGYTGVAATKRGVMLDVHTTVRLAYQEQPIMAYLLQFAEERARALCAADSTVPRQLYTWSFTPSARQLLEQYGYTAKSSDIRMQITFNAAPATPSLLQGIIIRPFIAGKEERDVYNVIAEAFPDIDGKPYRPFEEWYENVFEKSTSFEPSLLYVALAENQIVGTTSCRIYPEDNEVYIWQVAVRRAWRKRGIAKHLLLTAFGECYRRGIRHAQLSVDAENLTGAHQLYANVGMTQRSRVDKMVKII